MSFFADYHPAAVAICLMLAAGMGMFSMDPVILGLSLAGSLGYYLLLHGRKNGRAHLRTLLLFLLLALINPLTYHNGITVLFVMNHHPITLEALLYGLAAGGMAAAALYWFRCFSAIMTGDKLLCLFGRLSPRLSLILSMALRYVPLFEGQARKIRESQRALGLYGGENMVDSFRGGVRIFSVMVTWALENGIITADSMAARGYGLKRRTHYSIFRFSWRDGALTALALLLAGVTLFCTGGREIIYYPAFSASPPDAKILFGYAAYGMLSFLPAIIHGRAEIQWRFLQSRI